MQVCGVNVSPFAKAEPKLPRCCDSRCRLDPIALVVPTDPQRVAADSFIEIQSSSEGDLDGTESGELGGDDIALISLEDIGCDTGGHPIASP